MADKEHTMAHVNRVIRFKYPEPISTRSGCKVGWMTFATLELAKKASKVAVAESKVRAEEGYDFGYCSPGEITKVEGGFEVTVP